MDPKGNRETPPSEAAGWKRLICNNLHCNKLYHGIISVEYVTQTEDGTKLSAVADYSFDGPTQVRTYTITIDTDLEPTPEIHVEKELNLVRKEISENYNWSSTAGRLLEYRNLFYSLPRHFARVIRPYLEHPERLEFREDVKEEQLRAIDDELRALGEDVGEDAHKKKPTIREEIEAAIKKKLEREDPDYDL